MLRVEEIAGAKIYRPTLLPGLVIGYLAEYLSRPQLAFGKLSESLR